MAVRVQGAQIWLAVGGMAQSPHLRLRDVETAHRIVNECRELWADPLAWRQHLVEGASRLTGMTVSHFAEVSISSPAATPRFECHTASGFRTDSEWQVYRESLAVFPDLFVFFIGSRRLLQGLSPGNPAAALREELCPDDEWYRSDVYNEFRRPIQADGYAISVAERLPGRYTMLDINQNAGDSPPTLRSKRQLELLHRLVATWIGTELATSDQRSLYGLTALSRATLGHILDGKSEKQTAAALGLRLPTVHEYVGKLYRHFGVHSRAELMAYFIRRRPKPK